MDFKEGGSADDTPISMVMTRRVAAVRPEATLETVRDLFLDNAFSGAPVIDTNDRPIGIISKTDVLRQWREVGDRALHTLVSEVMMPLAFKLTEDASIARAAALMAFPATTAPPVWAPLSA